MSSICYIELQNYFASHPLLVTNEVLCRKMYSEPNTQNKVQYVKEDLIGQFAIADLSWRHAHARIRPCSAFRQQADT